MDFELTSSQQNGVHQAIEFAQTYLVPVADQNDRDGRFNHEAIQHMGPAGFLSMGGQDPISYVHVVREFGRACASTTVGMAVTNMVAETITRWGTPVQKEKYLHLINSGKVASFALTESHAGSDAAALKTTAKKTSSGYVLHGNKMFVSSGAYAGVVLLFARTHESLTGKQTDGISAFLVDRHLPGISVGREEDKMGLRSSNTVELVFNQCEIPSDALLGQEGKGFLIALGALGGGRIGVGAGACGTGEAALEAALAYAQKRRQFGQALSQMQAVQQQLADMRVELDAAWMLVLKAAYLKSQGKDFVLAASMAKLYGSEVANRVCLKAVQIHGGVGYTRKYPVERYFRDCKVTTLYEGTSEIHRTIIGRHVLKEDIA